MLKRVEHIFHEVVDLPLSSRNRYFIDNAVEEETRREVEALIGFESDANTSFSRDIGEIARLIIEPSDVTGTRCGPYLLASILGRGGMGAVYLAERVDGEVEQQVAVKLLSQLRARPASARALSHRTPDSGIHLSTQHRQAAGRRSSGRWPTLPGHGVRQRQPN